MELIEKIKQALCDNSPFDDDKPDDYEGEAQTVLTALIEHAGQDGVTEGDRSAAIEALNAAERQRSFGGNGTVLSQVRDIFARHRATAFAAGFADGFTAALQGAEAAIWRIEDDAFLYENVSKALQEVISELQAMEQNWTGRVTIEHRQAAIKERDAEIVAWLRVREEDYRMSGQGGYATVLDLAVTAIERGEV